MGLLDKLITGTYKNAKREKLFPETRGEVFSEIFRYRKQTLVSVSLMCALFALPTAVLVYLVILYRGMLPNFLADGSIPYPVEGDEGLSLLILSIQMNNLLSLCCFATNMVLFVGLGGCVHVMQNLVWGEPVSFLSDFGAGVRENWKKYLGYSLVFSLSWFFFSFVGGYYIVTEAHAAVKAVCIAIACVQLFLVCGALLFALPQANVYKLSFFATLKNGLIFFFVSFFKNFGLLLATILPLGLLFIPLLAVQTIVIILLLLLFPAYALLIWTLRANTLFDRFLNVGENESAKGKGIVWEDTENVDHGDTP